MPAKKKNEYLPGIDFFQYVNPFLWVFLNIWTLMDLDGTDCCFSPPLTSDIKVCWGGIACPIAVGGNTLIFPLV